jgi:hypothetical protein
VPPTTNTSTTNQPVVTFPTLQPGNALRSVYVTPPNGVTGTEVRYAADVATPTLTLSSAAPGMPFAVAPPVIAQVSTLAMVPPTSNTTGLNNAKLKLLRACKDGNFQTVWKFLYDITTSFNQGDPSSEHDVEAKFRDVHTVFAMIAQLCSEEGPLVDANPGTLKNVATKVGGHKLQRVWS